MACGRQSASPAGKTRDKRFALRGGSSACRKADSLPTVAIENDETGPGFGQFDEADASCDGRRQRHVDGLRARGQGQLSGVRVARGVTQQNQHVSMAVQIFPAHTQLENVVVSKHRSQRMIVAWWNHAFAICFLLCGKGEEALAAERHLRAMAVDRAPFEVALFCTQLNDA